MLQPTHFARSIILGVLVFFTSGIYAQQLEEIIVIAQKREQNLQEVPIAVSAFTAESMNDKALSNVQQIADFTPNVEMDYTSPFAGSSSVLSAYIRGIGQNDFAFNLEPGVGVYVDGVYYARTIGAVVDLLDLDHIEVLKGPQGTLFGRNTIGGAINVVTRRPSDEFAWQGEVTVGRFDRLDIRGSVDMPLIDDTLYSQVSFSSKGRDGYQKRIPFPGGFDSDSNNRALLRAANRFDDESGNEDQQNIRAKLLWLASDRLEVTLTGDYTHIDEQATPANLVDAFPDLPGAAAGVYNTCINTPAAILATLNPVATPGLPVDFTTLCLTPVAGAGSILGGVNADADPGNDRLAFDNRFITNDIDESFSSASNFSLIDSWGLGLTLDWEVSDRLSIKSISATRGLLARMGVDMGGTPFIVADPSFDTKQNQYSQELQFTGLAFDDRLDWLVGAYYFHEEGDLTDFVPFVGGLIQVFGRNDFDNDAWALFTHLNYAITDRLSVTLGLRYTEEDKEFEGQQRELNDFASKFLGLPAAAFPDPTDTTRLYPLGVQSKSFSDVTTKFGIEYRLTDDLFSYASFSEGFKSGGWTTRLLVPESPDPNLAPEFDEETATTYEIGIKSEWLDRAVQLNVAGFFTDYEDIQVTVQRGISPTFDNAGSGEILGFEAELVALLTDDFSLSGSLGYIDAEYTGLELFVDPNLDIDDKFVNTPEWAAHISAEYVMGLANGGRLTGRLDYSYKDEIANDAVNTTLLIADPTHLLNASLTYTAPGEKWELTAGGRNITDERFIYGGFLQPGIGFTTANFSRPAEWFLTLRLKN